MCKNLGFSLLELMITLAIVAILSTISIPLGNNLIIVHRCHVIETRLLSALNMARTAAITHHQLVTFCPSVDQKYCIADWQLSWLVFVNVSVTGKVKISQNILRVYNRLAYGKLTFKAFPTNRYFRFSPNGFSYNQNGTFSFCYQHKGWRIIINRLGRIRVESVQQCAA